MRDYPKDPYVRGMATIYSNDALLDNIRDINRSYKPTLDGPQIYKHRKTVITIKNIIIQ